jgi:polyphosphate glucokinase
LPDRVIEAVAGLSRQFDNGRPFGCGFPGVVQHGVIRTAVNLDPSWEGVDLGAALREATGRHACVLNDADAAAIAEMRLGAGRGREGAVCIVTVGTGLGTALFVDGKLVPNLELGHIHLDGEDAEKVASGGAREAHEWSWKKWARYFEAYLRRLEDLVWPDLFIIGGGTGKKLHKFRDYLEVRTELVPAKLRNLAGIVGAALAAAEAGAAGDER